VKKYIRIINRIFQSKIILNKYKKGFEELLYSVETKSFFSISDKKKMQSLFQMQAKTRIFFKKRKTDLYGLKGFIFIQSLNGFVVINLKDQKIYKVLHAKLEPDFLKNEKKASNLNNLNPKIFSSYTLENYNILVQNLEKNERKFFWKDWKTKLPDLLDFFLVRKNKLISYTHNDYVNEIKKKLNKIGINEFYLLNYQKEIKQDLFFLLEKYNKKSKTYKLFAHGDLTPNNVLFVNKKYVFIDFANGGLLNFTYDLMLQNFYFTNSKSWKEFDRINFKSNNEEDIFFSTSKYFFKKFERVYSVKINEKDIKLSLIIALSEIFIKNYFRYQSKEEWKDGIDIFENLKKICKHIIKSSFA
jgi:thiamine kinase-like enzyme